jgi:solute carrier family 25 carnitine/acylcarnitine transporter 20/29
MFFGGMGGLSGWCAGFILDNIKSWIQTDSFENPKYKSLPDTIKQLTIKDMTKGFVPGFVRGFPVNAMTFLAYEVA